VLIIIGASRQFGYVTRDALPRNLNPDLETATLTQVLQFGVKEGSNFGHS
jgi:hypothetical protein